MPMPLVSVIIPCFNAARWIRETLTSVFAQGGVELQVIVIDDGSTDESAELVAREFPNVELVRTANGGQCRARNVGLNHARGEFFQFVDADDVLVPEKIARQLDALFQTGADIAYGAWRKLYQNADGSTRLGETITRTLENDPAAALVRDGWSPPHAYLFRSAIVHQVGGFPEQYPLTGDAPFVIACALQGARFAQVPGVSALYRVSSQQMSRSDPVAFCRELQQSTQDAQAWWEAHAQMNPARREALVSAYAGIARMSYATAPATFEQAYGELLRLEPNYLPRQPRILRYLARLFGYPRAEELALRYRRLKRGTQALRSSASTELP